MGRNRALPALVVAGAAVVLVATTVAVIAQAPGLTPKEQLGKLIFFDENLSLNENQSCATCHDPLAGWTGSHVAINAHGSVYEGSIPGAFGDRKPPSSAYATFAPVFHLERAGNEFLFVGGNFWDGRATGETLGSPAAEQAKGPFLNPVEQALPDAASLVTKVCNSDYGDLFKQVWGAEVCDPANVATAYDNIGYSVAAFEGSAESNAFTSKFDLSRRGLAKLTQQEQRGFALFNGKGGCKACHPGNGPQAIFTDFTFDNLGLPKNPENPIYTRDPDFIDPGLGGYLAHRPEYAADYADANMGKHKVPTLRNVGKWDLVLGPEVKAFGHNGYFKTLEGIVHFYNTRDVLAVCPGDYTEAQALAAHCWPAPEVADNLNTDELGDLGLSADEEAAIVAFLKKLYDGYR